ncbi:hypothetical protein [Pseudonocardia lacus]|jgi:4-hydroxybenzoate polyprenyltransferase|uniref:hypothetical protein n=1 Tax=Pseudonocardia lacus TaxID=2835865 RepID=UPI001BDD9B39|nr:hypothetical protein [Pseudonocardia lacus]
MAETHPTPRRRSAPARALVVVFLVLGLVSVGLALWLQTWWMWLIAAVNLGTAYQFFAAGTGGRSSTR